jgi:hypothetical protein
MRIKKNNLSESVYQRLKKVAIARKHPMQEILRYYAIERFLYRLSISQYKKSFFLKGGLLLMIWNPQTYRATLDIDLLARVKNSADTLLQIIKEICALEGDSDGVEFDVRNVRLIETQLINPAFKQVTICLLQLCQINLPPRPSLSAMVLVVQNASALILLRFASAFCHLFECRVNNLHPIALDKVISELKQFFLPMLSEEKALQQQDKDKPKNV